MRFFLSSCPFSFRLPLSCHYLTTFSHRASTHNLTTLIFLRRQVSNLFPIVVIGSLAGLLSLLILVIGLLCVCYRRRKSRRGRMRGTIARRDDQIHQTQGALDEILNPFADTHTPGHSISVQGPTNLHRNPSGRSNETIPESLRSDMNAYTAYNGAVQRFQAPTPRNENTASQISRFSDPSERRKSKLSVSKILSYLRRSNSKY